MASLQSYASGSVVVTLDEQLGEISITGGVLEIDGALDAIPEIYHTIRCSSSGGIRSLAGASGKLGGRVQTLTIIEEDTAHGFGNDNGKYTSAGGGTGSRFGPGTTNTLIYENILWYIEGRGGRSDFDIAQGTTADGTGGAAVTFKGVHLIEQHDAGNAAHFNHNWSRNFKIEIHPALGFGWKISNYTLCHGILLEVQPNAQFAGLQVADVDYAGDDGGRVVVNPGANQTFTLFDLATPDITESGAPASAKTILVNPVGAPPTRTDNWSGYTSQFEVQRDVRFNFTGAADATGTLHALHANSNAEAADATAAIPASGSAAVRVKVAYSAANAASGAWTSLDGFRFAAYGRGFRKYYSGATAVNVGDAPAVRPVTLVNDAFPDGAALTAYSGTDAVADAAEFYRVVKDYELAHPDLPSRAESMAVIDGDGAIVMGASIGVVLSTTATDLIDDSSNILTVKADPAGLTTAAGIASIDFGASTILQSGTKALLKLPYTDSQGSSSQVLVTGMTAHFTGVYKADGTPLGSHTFASNGFAPAVLVSAADSAAGTKVVYAKPGETCTTRTLDLSGGGTFTVNFGDLPVERDQNGDPLYDATATLAGLVASFGSDGRCTLEIPNATATVKQLYKAFQDGVATEAGGRFCALGRQLLSISQYEGQVANLTLGPDIQLRRAASSGNDAAVAAVVSGGINGVKVNDDRGEVAFLPDPGGATDLTPVTTALAANAAALAAIRRMVRHVMASLPITWHAPFSPKCCATGMAGQEILRDTEESQWALTASGSAAAGDPNAEGIVTFDSQNSHIDYSLNRAGDGEPVDLYTAEVITMAQVRPTEFNAGTAQSLCSIGALLISIAPSSGSTAALRVGPINGDADTTAELTLGEFNDVVIAFSNNPDRPNNPRVRISINGAAEETVNVGAGSTISDGIFGPIGSNTENYRFGGHGTGAQTSGFIGQARAIFVHPDNELHGDAGWSIPAGLRWNEDYQLWLGAQIMDRIEGLAKDLIEAQLVEILGKVYTADEIGIFPWRALTSQLTSANGSIGKHVAGLANASPSAFADAVLDEAVSDHGSTGSLGAVLAAVKAEVDGLPSKEAIRDALLGFEAETGVTLLVLWRVIGAALAGRAAPAGASTDFRAAGGGAAAPKRLRMTTGDAEGERTNVEINPTD